MADMSGERRTEAFVRMREELRRLLRAGLIGTYGHLELLEVLATPRGGRTMNALSIVVLGDANLLVSATASTSTIKQIEFNLDIARHEPRVFTVADAAGKPVAARLELIERGSRSLIGEEPTTDAEFWLGRRNQLEEARRLAETREFVQYRPEAGSHDERARALADLRHLIGKHGGGGVDLWDPYLTADDLLQTPFWCRHADVRLRGLTDGRGPPPSATPANPPTAGPRTPKPPFPDRQRATLARNAGNLEGLRLEYRTRRSPEGWAFHDRFLIFPAGRDGPSAWSLGTSINSLGMAHHILQRVSNAALVAGAFEDLWRALSEPSHLIWKSWRRRTTGCSGAPLPFGMAKSKASRSSKPNSPGRSPKTLVKDWTG